MKKHSCFGFIGVIVLIFCAQTIFADPTSSGINSQPQTTFDIQAANQQLADYRALLSKKSTIREIRKAVTALHRLEAEAKQCSSDTKAALEKVTALIQPLQKNGEQPEALTAEQQYLKNKKESLSKRLSNCQLFVIQSSEAIHEFDLIAQKLTKRKLFTVRSDVLKKLATSTQLFQMIQTQFDKNVFIAESGIKRFTATSTALILFSATFVILLGIFILIRLFLKLPTLTEESSFTQRLHHAIKTTLKRYFLWLTIPLLFFCINGAHDILSGYITLLTWGSLLFTAYIGFLMLNYFFFYPFQADETISGLSTNITKPLKLRLQLLATLCFAAAVTYLGLKNQAIPELIDIGRTIFISLLAISLINILWLINRVPKVLEQHYLLRMTISIFLTATLSLVLLSEWLGYQQLAFYILNGIIFTLLFIFIAYLLHKTLLGFLRSLTKTESEWHNRFREVLGLELHENITEFFLLSFLIHILVWGGFLLALLKVWGLSDIQFQAVLNGLANGFQFGGITVIPIRFLTAILFLVIGLFIIRCFKTFYERRKDLEMRKGAQEAIAAIIGYTGNTIFFLLALVIAGINLSELAIIAGALSVGIGFGLQKIVNNFISGILLLIEQPIKPGDRIIIDGIEGFVKKIRLRHTQIQTLKFHDLIVPNSDITSKPLTNLTFRDFYGKSFIELHVAHHSDTQLVKKLLLEIAESHPDVIKTASRKPGVYFTGMSENGLKFELYCPIRHVNLNFDILNDLHFMIEKAFREHDINIIRPPRDIFVKELPDKLSNQKEK